MHSFKQSLWGLYLKMSYRKVTSTESKANTLSETLSKLKLIDLFDSL